MENDTPSSGLINNVKRKLFKEILHFTATLAGCQLVLVAPLKKQH